MPKLASGRHVGFSIQPYLYFIKEGSEEECLFATVAVRKNISGPESLLDYVVVCYFDEGDGIPPNAPAFSSGLCIQDILDGKSDWTNEEVAELRDFISNNTMMEPWLEASYRELDDAIKSAKLWDLSFMDNDVLRNIADEEMQKRAIIRKSALDPTAMSQLKGRDMQV